MSRNEPPMNQTATTQVEPRRIELETWPRKEHFEFFQTYEEPFFSITLEARCDGVLARCNKEGRSKTLALWHGVLAAVNQVEEFRYRVKDGAPVLYDRVHLSPTVLRPDGTFTIAFVPYFEELSEFSKAASEAIDSAKKSRGFGLDPSTRRIDLIHFSTVPWFKFTGVTHARATSEPGSEPKITIGKFGPSPSGGVTIPVAVTGHHGLMDGYHVGRFVETLEEVWK